MKLPGNEKADSALRKLDEQYQKYKYMEVNLSQKKLRQAERGDAEPVGLSAFPFLLPYVIPSSAGFQVEKPDPTDQTDARNPATHAKKEGAFDLFRRPCWS